MLPKRLNIKSDLKGDNTLDQHSLTNNCLRLAEIRQSHSSLRFQVNCRLAIIVTAVLLATVHELLRMHLGTTFIIAAISVSS